MKVEVVTLTTQTRGLEQVEVFSSQGACDSALESWFREQCERCDHSVTLHHQDNAGTNGGLLPTADRPWLCACHMLKVAGLREVAGAWECDPLGQGWFEDEVHSVETDVSTMLAQTEGLADYAETRGELHIADELRRLVAQLMRDVTL